MSAGKGDAPRNCFSPEFRRNFESIRWVCHLPRIGRRQPPSRSEQPKRKKMSEENEQALKEPETSGPEVAEPVAEKGIVERAEEFLERIKSTYQHEYARAAEATKLLEDLLLHHKGVIAPDPDEAEAEEALQQASEATGL